MVAVLVPVMVFLIFGLPTLLAGFIFLKVPGEYGKLAFLPFAPAVLGAAFVLTAGLLSRPFQKAIIPGKFPRQLTHFVYGPRRLYGLCWTAVFYFYPLYYAFLSVPFLKKSMFRLFGLKGTTNFTVYPDTWLRDLPVLSIGEGAYLSNKSTIGTNICLKNGDILVDGIQIEKGAMVGHLAILAPGVILAEDVEIGVGCAIGIRCKVGSRAKTGPSCTINHGAQIGEKCEIGTMSYVGIRAVIKDGLKVPAGANIPAGAVVNSEGDLKKILSSETNLLASVRDEVARILAGQTVSGPPRRGIRALNNEDVA